MNTERRPVDLGRRGVLTFEWALLITVLVIGIVGGLSAMRDALVDEMGDVAEAATSIDQSYTVTATGSASLGNAFSYADTPPAQTCPDGEGHRGRQEDNNRQGPIGGCENGK